MFRFFAVVLVIGAFVGALYFSGDALEAWESPKPETLAMPKLPKHEKRAKPKRPATHAEPAKRTVPAKPGWLVELNATCRRGQRQADSINPPLSLDRIAPMLRQAIEINNRMNSETAALVSRSGNAAEATRLRRLYAQDELLLQRALRAAEHGRYKRLKGIAQSLLPVAKAENKLFARLGAGACTVSADELEF